MPFDGPLVAGRWRLGPSLGKGAQAETFLARDEKARGSDVPEVVVKRLQPRGTWKAFDLLEREAKVLGQLRHPAVPRFHALAEEPPGTFNLVMERMPGENLRDLATRRRLSTVELRDVLIRVLEILDYLHGRAPAVVHRDIKPSNIVRAPDGKIALVDFGGVLDAARESGGSTVVGTFGYMAPEQLHGQATGATDVYALGATIVALAGGVEPEDVPRKGLRMDLARHLPSLDPGLRAALEAMTDPEPERRPQRARDVIALLAKGDRAGPAPRDKDRPDGKALVAPRPAKLARRARIFRDVPEPLATFLRLGLLGFAAGGWAGMAATRLAVLITFAVASVIALPRRKTVRELGHDVDDLLADGQHGFGDLARLALGRKVK
jgi:serine/threonine protein kinase